MAFYTSLCLALSVLVSVQVSGVLQGQAGTGRRQIHFTDTPQHSTPDPDHTDPLSAWISASSSSSSSRPNVLFLVVDDLLPRLGCYGDNMMVTPNIDKLASKSVLFQRAYAQQALCGPSRTSFLTGRRPESTRVFDLKTYWRDVAGNFTTLPQYFKRHGYFTQDVGKIFHPGHRNDAPYSWSARVFNGHPVSYGDRHSTPIQPRNESVTGKLQDTTIADFAVDWLNNRSQNAHHRHQPFFLAVGFHKPHLPFSFPLQFQALYPLSHLHLATFRSKPLSTADLVFSGNHELYIYHDIQNLNLSHTMDPLPEHYQMRLRQAYSSAISFTDSSVGRVLEALKRNGFADNTIISFIGDHGYHLGDNAMWGKHTNFEAATRVPMMMYVPGVTSPDSDFRHVDALAADPGTLTPARARLTTQALVELVDLYPTLAELAGLPAPRVCPDNNLHVHTCVEGTSLAPLLRGVISPSSSSSSALSSWKEAAFSQHIRDPREAGFNFTVMGYSVRTAQHRYAEWVAYDPMSFRANFSHVVARELYVHSTDPEEWHNVADVATHSATVDSLSQLLRAGWKATLQKYLESQH